jgi:hypothetical protein
MRVGGWKMRARASGRTSLTQLFGLGKGAAQRTAAATRDSGYPPGWESRGGSCRVGHMRR